MSGGYCIYLRKSRSDIEAESRGEGETLARHEKILFDLARRMKLEITVTYKEIVSGETISSRPVMQRVLSEVEQGMWTGVLVVEVERLARGDTIDQGIVAQSFKYSNTKIITPMKVYDPGNEFDEEYFEFGLFMSRREYKTINRRLQRGRLESVKEGKYLGTTPPYGYTRKKLTNEKGYTLEIHPEQADIVRLIFDLYSKGEMQPDGMIKLLGVSLIVRKLNDLKIQPMKGNVWVPSTVRGMLRNPVYIGKIRWNSRPEVKKMVDGKMVKVRPRAKKNDWILVDGIHEAIIDNDVYNLVKKRLTVNSDTPVPNKYIVKNPLAGLIVCGMCGRKMVRRPYNNEYPDGLICNVPSCKNISSQLTIVEDKLMDALELWLHEYNLELETNRSNTTNNNLQLDIIKKSISKLGNEIKTLETQSDNLHDLLEQGIYSTEKFLERSKVITAKINSIQTNRDGLIKLLNQNRTIENSKKTIIPKIEKLLQVYSNLTDPAGKNHLLREVIEKIVYTKTVNGRWHGKPDDFQLELYPRLPK